ncbi:hypothetical protein [Janthinobacterium sp. GW458P]|uniref:hypothetical protein n=1 Tax=Janthinobacterium sp. GW458P TaxID=1981504 RepID=UPI000A327FEA|nr:hypothetical protein [Janthinobacterium sp. GW458P]MBE3025023.1 hypothetical protein [Janthinobacterium sp. GW458P]PHV17695.1 hypothetical protein CSQ90_05025 [Janthinobacterium sp. BJB303]
MSGIPARPCKPARAEWIRFAPADDASAQAAMMANLRPVLWRSVLLGGCALILAFVGQAVWRDMPYAGEAVLFGPLALAAWMAGLVLFPGRALLFHVELGDAGLLLRRHARRLPGWDKSVQLELAQLQRLEVVTYGGALQVYRTPAPLARVELLLYTTLGDCPLIRVVGLNLPVPQRWSLCQIKGELLRRCKLAGIPVSETFGPLSQQAEAIRARWPQA